MRLLLLLVSLTGIACGPPPPSSGGGRRDSGQDAGASTDAGQDVDAGGSLSDAGSAPIIDAGPLRDAGAVAPETVMVDPQCLDGQYREVLPTADAEIGAIVQGYSPSNWRGRALSCHGGASRTSARSAPAAPSGTSFRIACPAP